MKVIKVLIALALLIFLSGCVELGLNTNVQQKIYRDGTEDISIKISAKTAEDLNVIKQGFEVKPEFAGKQQVLESDGVTTYSFTGVKIGDELFELTGSQENRIFLKKETYSLKREFKFPFYKYTYTMDFSGAEPGRDLQQEIKDKCDKAKSLKEELEIAKTLSSEKLKALNAAASQEEKQALLSAVREARDKEVELKAQIDAITKDVQCEEKPIAEDQVFNGVTYVIEGFGSVSDTNGVKIDSGKVQFKVPEDSKKAYYVTFISFFIADWFARIF